MSTKHVHRHLLPSVAVLTSTSNPTAPQLCPPLHWNNFNSKQKTKWKNAPVVANPVRSRWPIATNAAKTSPPYPSLTPTMSLPDSYSVSKRDPFHFLCLCENRPNRSWYLMICWPPHRVIWIAFQPPRTSRICGPCLKTQPKVTHFYCPWKIKRFKCCANNI